MLHTRAERIGTERGRGRRLRPAPPDAAHDQLGPRSRRASGSSDPTPPRRSELRLWLERAAVGQADGSALPERLAGGMRARRIVVPGVGAARRRTAATGARRCRRMRGQPASGGAGAGASSRPGGSIGPAGRAGWDRATRSAPSAGRPCARPRRRMGAGLAPPTRSAPNRHRPGRAEGWRASADGQARHLGGPGEAGGLARARLAGATPSSRSAPPSPTARHGAHRTVARNARLCRDAGTAGEAVHAQGGVLGPHERRERERDGVPDIALAPPASASTSSRASRACPTAGSTPSSPPGAAAGSHFRSATGSTASRSPATGTRTGTRTGTGSAASSTRRAAGRRRPRPSVDALSAHRRRNPPAAALREVGRIERAAPRPRAASSDRGRQNHQTRAAAAGSTTPSRRSRRSAGTASSAPATTPGPTPSRSTTRASCPPRPTAEADRQPPP